MALTELPRAYVEIADYIRSHRADMSVSIYGTEVDLRQCAKSTLGMCVLDICIQRCNGKLLETEN